MTKIIMNGCYGKMGRMITELCKEDSEVSIVAGIDVVCTGDSPYRVYQDITEFTGDADVVIDFSSAKITDKLLDYCISRKIPVVLCTTGLSEEQLSKVKEASKEIAILRSANMSLGVNLIIKHLKEISKVLVPAGFDIEIVEKHHNQKVDAPSGTALALADAAGEGFNFDYVYDRSGKREKRTDHEIGISSVRGGTIVGDHDVIFAGTDEVITISHRAYSRALFGKGAIAAAKFLAGKAPGMYDMSDVIG